MNYTVTFPLDRDIRSPQLKALVRQLTTFVESLKVRYRIGLTDEVLKTEITRFALNNNMVPAGSPVGQGIKLKYPKTGIQPEIVTLTFTPASLANSFLNCPCCGLAKKGPTEQVAATVHSHSIIAASMWPAIILEAVAEMGVSTDALNPVEKKIIGHMVNVGLSTAGVGADDSDSSFCSRCENLHANFSLLQRREKALLDQPRVDWVGLQNGATLQNPGGDLRKLRDITFAQIGRVAARLEDELVTTIWKHFQKQELSNSPTAMKGTALTGLPLEQKKTAIASTALPWAAPNVKYTSTDTGYVAETHTVTPTAKNRETSLPPLLEFLLMNVDQFMRCVKHQAISISERFPPLDYAPYKDKFDMS